jgi:hypothetical protein
MRLTDLDFPRSLAAAAMAGRTTQQTSATSISAYFAIQVIAGFFNKCGFCWQKR